MTDQNPSGNVSEEQVEHFSWWICMLPFLVAVGVFVWKWYQNRTDQVWLLYGIAALVAGIVVSALFSGGGQSAATASGDANSSTVTPTDSTPATKQD